MVYRLLTLVIVSIVVLLLINFPGAIDRWVGSLVGHLDTSPNPASTLEKARADPAFICEAQCSPKTLILNGSSITVTEAWIQLRESRFPSDAKYFLCLKTDPVVELNWFDDQKPGAVWGAWSAEGLLTSVDVSESVYKRGSWVIMIHEKSKEKSARAVIISWSPISNGK